MSLQETKQLLRRDLRTALAAITPADRARASAAASARILQLPEYQHARIVMTYMPLATEIDPTNIATHALASGRTVCVPRTDWPTRTMAAVRIDSLDGDRFETDARGIRYPRSTDAIDPAAIDVLIAPGLGFDRTGARLGRGAGFYDRFLAQLDPRTLIVGLAFDQQVIASVPQEPTDVRVHALATQTSLLRVR